MKEKREMEYQRANERFSTQKGYWIPLDRTIEVKAFMSLGKNVT
jgi:hypothetical protein